MFPSTHTAGGIFLDTVDEVLALISFKAGQVMELTRQIMNYYRPEDQQAA